MIGQMELGYLLWIGAGLLAFGTLAGLVSIIVERHDIRASREHRDQS
jgi:hypothetical protein